MPCIDRPVAAESYENYIPIGSTYIPVLWEAQLYQYIFTRSFFPVWMVLIAGPNVFWVQSRKTGFSTLVPAVG